MTDDDYTPPLDAGVEWKLRALAVPITFVLALAFNYSGVGHMVQRTFLTMVPHELGHAITAWWSGYAAVPTLWKTLIPEARSTLVPLVVIAAEVGVAYLGWRANRMALVFVALAFGALQFVASTCAPGDAAIHITFGGDGGALVLGSLLVLTFFAPAGSKLRTGGLRWGLLVIGAAAYVDTAMTWWRARSDLDLIPFGEIEGVGLSDPSRLSEAGWSPELIVARYVTLAELCLAVIAIVWIWQTLAMRRAALSSSRS